MNFMSTYLIYGKIIKPVPLSNGKGGKITTEPQSTFRALNYGGQRVSKLSEAGEYYEKSMAQKVIDYQKKCWEKKGYPDHILYEIREVK